MLGAAISRNAIILGLFAAATAALLALTNALTEARIKCQRQHSLENSLAEVFPSALADNALGTSYYRAAAPELGRGSHRIFRAWKDDRPSGVVLETSAPDGYGGRIDLLVGIGKDGGITGVRVVPPHRETPGLGDKIETRKSDWILSFDGHSLTNTPDEEWAVRKDGGTFDAFTGATITPRAVVSAVHRALLYHAAHQQEIFLTPATAVDTGACDD